MNEKELEKLNELWENYRYKDNEYPELSDNFQFSVSEWVLLRKYTSKPQLLELFKDTYMEINALKEDVDYTHYTPDITDFDMFIERDGTVVYDEKAYQKAVDDAEKFYDEFCKRQNRVEAVREQYPEEMKVLEKFFNAPEDCLREREKFFSELIQNKELLANITNTYNENLEQVEERIYRKESSMIKEISEDEKIILDFLKTHPNKGISFYKKAEGGHLSENNILLFNDTHKSFSVDSDQIQRIWNTNDLLDISKMEKLFSDDEVNLPKYMIEEIATFITLNKIKEVSKEQLLQNQKLKNISFDAHLMIMGYLKGEELEKFKKEYNSLSNEEQGQVQKQAVKETISYMEEPFEKAMSQSEREKVEIKSKQLFEEITEQKTKIVEINPDAYDCEIEGLKQQRRIKL